ncbi:hypothetical protein GCM10027261_43130 [Geodermatophilus arenarius]
MATIAAIVIAQTKKGTSKVVTSGPLATVSTGGLSHRPRRRPAGGAGVRVPVLTTPPRAGYSPPRLRGHGAAHPAESQGRTDEGRPGFPDAPLPVDRGQLTPAPAAAG